MRDESADRFFAARVESRRSFLNFAPATTLSSPGSYNHQAEKQTVMCQKIQKPIILIGF